MALQEEGDEWEVQWVRVLPWGVSETRGEGEAAPDQCQSLVPPLQTQAGKLHRGQEASHFGFSLSLWFECKYTLRTLIPLDPALLEALLEDPVV